MGAVKNFYHDAIIAQSFERVALEDFSYIATVADFPEGCSILADGEGREVATGKNILGGIVTLPLDVPLCMSCDGEIEFGVCESCELYFTGGAA